MKRKEFNAVVDIRCAQIKSVLTNKAKEYSMNDDAFHNFNKGVDISFTDSREKVAWEYMTKHLQSIKDMIEKLSKGEPPTAGMISEKIGDAINYLILIEGMLVENQAASKTFEKS